MIGVDVVDLSDPLLKKRTGAELRFISHPEDKTCEENGSMPGLLFWAFWAAKEAIFKTHRLAAGFSPKKIQIEFTSREGDMLHFRGYWHNKAEGKLFLSPAAVWAVASTDPLRQIRFARHVMTTAMPSSEVRKKLSATLPAGWSVGTDDGNLPVLINQQVSVPLSFSHHHHLGASAWLEFADGVE